MHSVVSTDTNLPLTGEPTTSRSRTARLVGTILVLLALATGGTTFAVLTGLTPVEPNEGVVAAALAINTVLVVGLMALVGLEAAKLWLARRRGRAGARLHLRILGLFSVIAVAPAIIVAVIASVTLDRGLDSWFSDRTRSIINTSLSVAESYLREHGQVIRADLLAMAADLGRVEEYFEDEPQQFRRFLAAQAAIRALPVAMILREDMTVVMESEIDPQLEFLMPPPDAIRQAREGEVVVIAPGMSNQVGAVVQLTRFDDAYLYVARSVDPQVINYLRMAQANVAEYSSLERQRFGVQVAFALIYVGFALILLLSAVWIGIGFANRLVSPIRRLMGAADQVAQGNLYVQVPLYRAEGDLASLGKTFNKMTTQLRSQRDDLLAANETLDERRRFIETVLSGVPAGVLGVDNSGLVTLANRSAADLLGMKQDEIVDRPLNEIAPEIAPVAAQARTQRARLLQDQVTIRRAGAERIVAVRVATERAAVGDYGVVVTLDDITELVTAQRSSAWADVARRIAHEIKNPLTPIQLSAERLRRKYGKVITSDRDVFDQCTDTIIRQVGDIGRMVDEFSSFARMPKPAIEEDDVAETVKQAVFLMRVGNPEIDIGLDLPEAPVHIRFDRRLISQAVTNIIKNAVEAIAARAGTDLPQGRISVQVAEAGPNVVIEVTDNGIGLPKENRQRLLEPYMTTREKGTGLGLAIVGRIMEEHGGTIELGDAPDVARGGQGARVRLVLAKRPAAAADDPVSGPDLTESGAAVTTAGSL